MSCKGRSATQVFLGWLYLNDFCIGNTYIDFPWFPHECGHFSPHVGQYSAPLIWTLFSSILGAGFPLHKPYPYTLYRRVKCLVIIMTPGMNINPKGWYRMPVLHLWHFIQASDFLGVVIDPLTMLTLRWKRQAKCHCYWGEPAMNSNIAVTVDSYLFLYSYGFVFS